MYIINSTKEMYENYDFLKHILEKMTGYYVSI